MKQYLYIWNRLSQVWNDICTYITIRICMKQVVAGMKWHGKIWNNTYTVWNDICRYEIIRIISYLLFHTYKCHLGMNYQFYGMKWSWLFENYCFPEHTPRVRTAPKGPWAREWGVFVTKKTKSKIHIPWSPLEILDFPSFPAKFRVSKERKKVEKINLGVWRQGWGFRPS